MSRVDSVRFAKLKWDDHVKQGLQNESMPVVLASDAFFPFSDGIEAAAKAGATAIIQPGGSMRDAEVIQAANEHNIAMLFTGQRHFQH